jgi:hypothetical protein
MVSRSSGINASMSNRAVSHFLTSYHASGCAVDSWKRGQAALARRPRFEGALQWADRIVDETGDRKRGHGIPFAPQ